MALTIALAILGSNHCPQWEWTSSQVESDIQWRDKEAVHSSHNSLAVKWANVRVHYALWWSFDVLSFCFASWWTSHGNFPCHLRYGELQGLNKQETADRFGKEQVHEWRRSYDIPPPNGESLEMCAERAVAYFKDQVRLLRNTWFSWNFLGQHAACMHTKVCFYFLWFPNYDWTATISTNVPLICFCHYHLIHYETRNPAFSCITNLQFAIYFIYCKVTHVRLLYVDYTSTCVWKACDDCCPWEFASFDYNAFGQVDFSRGIYIEYLFFYNVLPLAIGVLYFLWWDCWQDTSFIRLSALSCLLAFLCCIYLKKGNSSGEEVPQDLLKQVSMLIPRWESSVFPSWKLLGTTNILIKSILQN